MIDYPVMHHPTDNNYYLHRDFDKNWSDPGTIYVDTRCDIETPGDNLIIYGHNMKSGKMFASLFRFEKEEYYKKYKYIRFDTIHEKAIYEIIAAFRTEIYPEDYTGFKYYEYLNISNETSFNNYVENCRRLTPYETSSAEYGDKLITLSTCAYHDENGRYVVVAKKVLK